MCRSYYEHSPLCKHTCNEGELLQLWKAWEAATRGLAAGERAPPRGLAKAGAAAMGELDDGEREPPCGSANLKTGAAATGGLDDGERAPPGGSAEAGAAETDDDTETPEQMLKWAENDRTINVTVPFSRR